MNGYCDKKECRELADVRPVLLIFPPWPSDCPARGMVGMEFCRPHGEALTVEDLVTDEGWEKILCGFDRLGRIAPERSRTQVVLEPVMHAERN